jgi:glycosyltransferase involved in cell wall biosynthesis
MRAEGPEIAIDVAPLLGLPTGVGAFVSNLLKGVANTSRAVVHAYALSARGAAPLASKLDPNVEVHKRPMPAGALLRVWRQFEWPPVEFWTGPVDVVHGTNFIVPPSKSARRLVTVHDLTAIRFPEMCTPATLRYPGLLKRAIDQGAEVHVFTDAIRSEVLCNFDIDESRIHTIHNAVPPVSDVRPASWPKPYLLAIGTIEPRKDYATLLDAFEKCSADIPDVELLIAGSPGWGFNEFQAKLAHSPLAGRVKLLGRVSDSRRASLLKGATALVYPSVYEGFGLPPLEAMQVGVPVVSTNDPAISEVTADAAVLVPSEDADALARALVDIVGNSELRNRMIVAGRHRVKTFDLDAATEKMLTLYEKLASQ